jgi:hypothetical protein
MWFAEDEARTARPPRIARRTPLAADRGCGLPSRHVSARATPRVRACASPSRRPGSRAPASYRVRRAGRRSDPAGACVRRTCAAEPARWRRGRDPTRRRAVRDRRGFSGDPTVPGATRRTRQGASTRRTHRPLPWSLSAAGSTCCSPTCRTCPSADVDLLPPEAACTRRRGARRCARRLRPAPGDRRSRWLAPAGRSSSRPVNVEAPAAAGHLPVSRTACRAPVVHRHQQRTRPSSSALDRPAARPLNRAAWSDSSVPVATASSGTARRVTGRRCRDHRSHRDSASALRFVDFEVADCVAFADGRVAGRYRALPQDPQHDRRRTP